MVGHHRVIAGFLNAEYRHVGYLLPLVLKSVRFGSFVPLYYRPASHEGKDMGGFVCAAHKRKNRGFPTLKRALDLGIEKGRLLQNSRPNVGGYTRYFSVRMPETIDITGFFKKFCIATGTIVGASFISLAPTFFQKSERAHAAAPPLQIEPAPPGFDLGTFDGNRRFCIAIRTRLSLDAIRVRTLFFK